MRGRSDYQPSGRADNGLAYEEVFVRHVFQLLGMGYSTLKSEDYVDAQEEDITGELTRAIDAVLDSQSAPSWADWFSVHEEARIHDLERKGKRRRRLDIRIDSAEKRPRTGFCFEAKRLGSNHGVSNYLGVDGLQCLLDGRYAANDNNAGMLGYVQDGRCDDWAQKIEFALNRGKKTYGLRKNSPWQAQSFTKTIASLYRSGHDRPSVGFPIDIYHALFPFH